MKKSRAFAVKKIKTNAIPKTEFHIIVSGLNIFRHVFRCLKSIRSQSYQNYTVHLLSDAHDTALEINPKTIKNRLNFQKNIELHLSKDRQGKANLVFDYLKSKRFNNNSVTVMLDSDDRFYKETALETFAEAYNNFSPDVCWSTYIGSNGKLGHCAPIIKDLSHRLQGWKSSHCFTYRSKLIEKVPKSFILNDNGEPFMEACDIALALPILDIAENKLFIPEILYEYTVTNPESHHNQEDGIRLSSARQKKSRDILYAKDPLVSK